MGGVLWDGYEISSHVARNPRVGDARDANPALAFHENLGEVSEPSSARAVFGGVDWDAAFQYLKVSLVFRFRAEDALPNLAFDDVAEHKDFVADARARVRDGRGDEPPNDREGYSGGEFVFHLRVAADNRNPKSKALFLDVLSDFPSLLYGVHLHAVQSVEGFPAHDNDV